MVRKGRARRLKLVAAAGIEGAKAVTPILTDEANKGGLLGVLRQALLPLVDQLNALGENIGQIERAIHAQHRASDASRRRETIPSIGVIGTTAISATVTAPHAFKSWRALAA